MLFSRTIRKSHHIDLALTQGLKNEEIIDQDLSEEDKNEKNLINPIQKGKDNENHEVCCSQTFRGSNVAPFKHTIKLQQISNFQNEEFDEIY
jgi:hypothetical protein